MRTWRGPSVARVFRRADNRGMSSARAILAALLGVALGFGACRPAERDPTRSPQELRSELEAAFALPGRRERLTALGSTLAFLRAANLEAALGVYAEVAPQPVELVLLMDAWTGFDPPSALEYAARLPSRARRESAVRAAIEGWAWREPLAARAAVDDLVESSRRTPRGVRGALVRGWARAPQGGVEDYLLSWEDDLRDEVMGPAISAVLRRDGPAGLLRWSQDLMSRSEIENQRWWIFRKTVRTLGERAPELAAAWVLEHRDEPQGRSGTQILVTSWQSVDPEAAFAWLRGEAPAPLRGEAMRAAYQAFQQRDPAEAAAWLGAQPSDPFFDPARAVSARVVAARDPAAAAAVCEGLAAESARHGCVLDVGPIWLRRDAERAEAWLASLSIPEEDLTRMRARARPRAQSGPRRGSFRSPSETADDS